MDVIVRLSSDPSPVILHNHTVQNIATYVSDCLVEANVGDTITIRIDKG